MRRTRAGTIIGGWLHFVDRGDEGGNLSLTRACVGYGEVLAYPVPPDGTALLKPDTSFGFEFFPAPGERAIVPSQGFEGVGVLPPGIQIRGSAPHQLLGGGQR